MFNNEQFEAKQESGQFDHLNAAANQAVASEPFFTASFASGCVSAAKAGAVVGVFAAGFIVISGVAGWSKRKIFD